MRLVKTKITQTQSLRKYGIESSILDKKPRYETLMHVSEDASGEKLKMLTGDVRMRKVSLTLVRGEPLKLTAVR